MKKLLLVFILSTLCGCAALNSFLGIDENGNKVEGTPPVTYLVEVMKAFGPVGLLIGGAITASGAAYVGNKRGYSKFETVVAAIQKSKDSMNADEKKQMVGLLKKHIPNELHGAIKRVKDKL